MLQKITFSQLSGNLASINPRNVPTRGHDATLLNVLRPKSKLCKKSNCYNGPTLWNNLPVHIRSLKDKKQFKSEIKKFYTNKFLTDNNCVINYW